MENNKKKLLINTLIIVGILIAAFIFMGINETLVVTTYDIESDKISSDIKIALITDLHSSTYGSDEENLLNRIDEECPDVIMLCGDIFDDILPDKNADLFLKGVSEKYPCYYVTGNHEYMASIDSFEEKFEILKKYNIYWLPDMNMEVTIKNETINLVGVNDPYKGSFDRKYHKTDVKDFSERLKEAETGCHYENYTILLTHRPELINEYQKYSFDLILAGHAHGGQWRAPWSKNGLFAPHQGFFPKYSGGMYTFENTTMVVSRGLSKDSSVIPRIYNKPEVVIINLH